jgi:hypothetical protein
VIALVHRDDPLTLAEVCQKLTNAFPQGDFIRETEVAWQMWLKSTRQWDKCHFVGLLKARWDKNSTQI